MVSGRKEGVDCAVTLERGDGVSAGVARARWLASGVGLAVREGARAG